MDDLEYERMAAVEDRMWWYHGLHVNLRRSLLAYLPADTGARVLDAGCGTGGFVRHLRRHCPLWEIQGLDLSPVALAWARRQQPDGCWVEGSVTALPYLDAEFDAVVSADVVSYVAQPKDGLAELVRVLRPGGTLVLNLPAHRWMRSYHDEAVGMCHRFGPVEIRTLLQELPLEAPKVRPWNLALMPLAVLQRKVLRRRQQASDVRVYPVWQDTLARGALALERTWMHGLGFPLPAGLSLLITARKRG